uniref:serpin B4-like n=1 Tax=Arvicanthis niloticus TaxID=61156 RepID=UPI001487162A|nr:serpin B4-like [Arvicanthis niloticus]
MGRTCSFSSLVADSPFLIKRPPQCDSQNCPVVSIEMTATKKVLKPLKAKATSGDEVHSYDSSEQEKTCSTDLRSQLPSREHSQWTTDAVEHSNINTGEHCYIDTEEHHSIDTEEHCGINTEEHSYIETVEHCYTDTEKHYETDRVEHCGAVKRSRTLILVTSLINLEVIVLQFNETTKETTEKPAESHATTGYLMPRKTARKIKDLFPSGSLSSSTILVLVNAVYFKGQWNHKFDEKQTTEEKFWLNKNTSKSVQMMKPRNKFNFIFLKNVQAKIVEIPYQGKELSMFILLPVEIDGLKKLEEQLTADKLLEWTNPENMHMTNVYLSLPQFKLEEKYDLPGPLEHMGMVDAFNPQKADFSGMSSTQGLVVSNVLHKSFVEVNEEGTEAATASRVKSHLLSAPVPKDFSCNQAFQFMMKQNKTNIILFLGRMSSS